ncbi:phosphatase domain-containing protein [Algoriphagus namhaensis]
MSRPIVWQLSVVQFEKTTWINGVILQKEPYLHKKRVGKIKNLFKLLSSYFVQTYADKEITLRVDGEAIRSMTDAAGNFSVFVQKPEVDQVTLFAESQQNPLPLAQDFPVYSPASESAFDFISDLDDTLVVSHTADHFRRISTLAFTPPEARKPIGFSSKLLEEFKDSRITYVSKSESNLFGFITSFFVHHGLPFGQLVLTPYLSMGELIASRKKGLEFKLDTIRTIIAHSSPSKQFILIGDDTQQDMKVYCQIVQEYPDKILKIYIHQTRKELSGSLLDHYRTLLDTGVPFLYFSDEKQVAEEIQYLKTQKK